MMEKEEKSERGTSLMMMKPPLETEFFLQWGNKKRMRCVRIRSSNSSSPPHPSSSSADISSSNSTRIRRRITSRFLSLPSHEEKHLSFPPQPTSRLTRNSEAAATLRSESQTFWPEEEEERSSHTGGNHQAWDEHIISTHCHSYQRNMNMNSSSRGVGEGNLVWPKLCISLSSKEKEEDFLAMKGCKLPQRPKKRAKVIQRTILLVSPGAWLSDMSLERYEVREKKTSKKRPRGGLKAMGNLDSDSD